MGASLGGRGDRVCHLLADTFASLSLLPDRTRRARKAPTMTTTSTLPDTYMGVTIDRAPVSGYYRAFYKGWTLADDLRLLQDTVSRRIAPDGVYAVWFGGTNYAPSEVTRDVERFDTREDAVDAMRERAVHGHTWRQDFPYVNREHERVLTPNADAGEVYMDLYWADPTHDTDPVPDERVTWTDED